MSGAGTCPQGYSSLHKKESKVQRKRLKLQDQISFLVWSLILILLIKQKRGERFGLHFISKNSGAISIKFIANCQQWERISEVIVPL